MSGSEIESCRSEVLGSYQRHASGNEPGIQRPASLAGNAIRSGALVLTDCNTPAPSKAETMRRACRYPVPTTMLIFWRSYLAAMTCSPSVQC